MYLDFEQALNELGQRLEVAKSEMALRGHDDGTVQRLEKRYAKTMQELYEKLSPWDRVQVARVPERPKTKDYVRDMMSSWTPLSGDRTFGEDEAIISGIGLLRDIPVMVMGHEKGHDTASRLQHHFGMASPEGYRKATRLLYLAERLKLPVVFLVDTPGAAAGTQAEERGQAQAIAECIQASLRVHTPILSVVIGEGGSGGAVAFATANVIAMLENSVYSVISPEGCASILWRTADKKKEAASAQKLTAQDLKSLGLIDHIIPEPPGGAHRQPQEVIRRVGDYLYQKLKHTPHSTYGVDMRRTKFLSMGQQLGV